MRLVQLGRRLVSGALHPFGHLQSAARCSCAVVHNHSPSVIPFGVSSVSQMRPLYPHGRVSRRRHSGIQTTPESHSGR